MDHTHDWLTPSQAAKCLGVSIRTLWRWEEQGRLTPTRTLGGHRRYSAADIDALQAAHTTPETTTGGGQ